MQAALRLASILTRGYANAIMLSNGGFGELYAKEVYQVAKAKRMYICPVYKVEDIVGGLELTEHFRKD